MIRVAYSIGKKTGLELAADIIAAEYDRAACGAGKAALLFAAAEIKKELHKINESIAKDNDR